LLKRFAEHLVLRWRLLVGVALLAVATRLVLVPAPPPPTVEGLAAMLGQAIGGTVAPAELVWEPSGGAWRDLLWGRNLLFLAAPHGQRQRDLYRAAVRVSREGKPISVRYLRNLSATPMGDERGLTARPRYAAYLTQSNDGVAGATVIDLQGHALADLPWHKQLSVGLDNWLRVGSVKGLARVELAFGKQPSRVAIELRRGQLILALGEPPRAAALDLASAQLNTGGDMSYEPLAWTVPRRVKPMAHFLMDTLRAVLGTNRADTIKALLFGARTRLKRWSATSAEPAPSAPPSNKTPTDASHWPPQSIRPLFKHPLEEEGIWAPGPKWLPPARGMVGKPAPYMFETIIRPDPELPFAYLRLVAIDTRQLQLRIEAGYDEPRPLTGPGGRGRIPKHERPGLVAAFNGAFQTRHGTFGMVVDRRVLLPPAARAATVAIDAFGRTRMGSWGDDARMDASLVSLRQNLDPLIEDGVINPRGRKQWGFVLDGNAVLTERSALCMTKDGYLMYGWGIEVSALTLAKGLKRAGCQYAIHLDMNPGHVGFAYLNNQQRPARRQLLAGEMSIPPNRYLKASPKDFFYLVLRDPTPKLGNALSAKPANGEQPRPTWLPAVHEAKSKREEAPVQLWAIDADRFGWQIRPGSRERAGRTAQGPLSEAEHAQAMIAIGLGRGLRKHNRRGLVLDGVVALPIRPDLGYLSTAPSLGAMSIGRSVADMAPDGDSTELVLLALGGKQRSEARELGPHRKRSAACLLDDGTMLVGLMRADNDEPLTKVLLQAGCSTIVALNRGKQVQAFVHRAGTDTPPKAAYGDTALYGMARTAHGTARPLQ